MEETLKATAKFIPDNALKFALGIGTPQDIVKCVRLGWDMFDCVIPTREGRHGRVFVWNNDVSVEKKDVFDAEKNFFQKIFTKKKSDKKFYGTLNMTNKKFKQDFRPIEKTCSCELCQNHSRAYLYHLLKMKDPLGMRLAAMHNLTFYSELMKKLNGNF